MGLKVKMNATWICDGCGKKIKDIKRANRVVSHTGNYYFHNDRCLNKWPLKEAHEHMTGEKL